VVSCDDEVLSAVWVAIEEVTHSLVYICLPHHIRKSNVSRGQFASRLKHSCVYVGCATENIYCSGALQNYWFFDFSPTIIILQLRGFSTQCFIFRCCCVRFSICMSTTTLRYFRHIFGRLSLYVRAQCVPMNGLLVWVVSAVHSDMIHSVWLVSPRLIQSLSRWITNCM